MSVKAMSAAFDAGDDLNLPAIDRLLLLRLGDWADDYGYCFPGIADLVAKVGVDERTIRRHLSALEEVGLVDRRIPGGGRTRSTLYRILPDYLPDSRHAPGRLRYLSRFKIKGDRESAFPDGEGTGQTGKGDTRGRKGGHSSVPRSVSIHQDPSEIDFDLQNLNPPRLPGESHREYMFRIADSFGQD